MARNNEPNKEIINKNSCRKRILFYAEKDVEVQNYNQKYHEEHIIP